MSKENKLGLSFPVKIEQWPDSLTEKETLDLLLLRHQAELAFEELMINDFPHKLPERDWLPMEIASLYAKLGKLEESKQITKRHHGDFGKHFASISGSFLKLGLFNEAEAAIREFEPFPKCINLARLGETLISHDEKKANQLFDEALENTYLLGSNRHFALRRIAESLIKIKEFDKAKAVIYKISPIYRSTPSLGESRPILSCFAHELFIAGQQKEAEEAVKELNYVVRTDYDKIPKSDAVRELSIVFASIHKFDEAERVLQEKEFSGDLRDDDRTTAIRYMISELITTDNLQRAETMLGKLRHRDNYRFIAEAFAEGLVCKYIKEKRLNKAEETVRRFTGFTQIADIAPRIFAHHFITEGDLSAACKVLNDHPSALSYTNEVQLLLVRQLTEKQPNLALDFIRKIKNIKAREPLSFVDPLCFSLRIAFAQGLVRRKEVNQAKKEFADILLLCKETETYRRQNYFIEIIEAMLDSYLEMTGYLDSKALVNKFNKDIITSLMRQNNYDTKTMWQIIDFFLHVDLFSGLNKEQIDTMARCLKEEKGGFVLMEYCRRFPYLMTKVSPEIIFPFIID